jgi:hypothetical protein
MNDIVLHYSCEDTAGNGLPVVDDTPNGYNGSQVGSMVSGTGIIGNCFNMLGPYINLPDIRSEFSDEASINVWLKKEQQVSAQDGLWLLSSYLGQTDQYPDSAGAYPYRFDAWRASSGINFVYDSGFDLEEWHMLTVTTEPGTDGYKVYQNASEKFSGTGEATISMHGSWWPIGRSGGGQNYRGLWDLTGIWSRAITPSEITDLFQSGAGLPYESPDFPGVGILGHEFAVAVPGVSVLGHDFAVELGTSNILGHEFTIPSKGKLLRDISQITRRRLRGI